MELFYQQLSDYTLSQQPRCVEVWNEMFDVLLCLQYCNGGDLADYLQGTVFMYALVCMYTVFQKKVHPFPFCNN